MMAAATITLVACATSDDDPWNAPTAAVGLPDASSFSAPGSTVAYGDWGVVEDYDSIGDPPLSTVAIRIGTLRQGTTSDFDDVTIFGGLPKNAMAYYANVEYSVLEGFTFDSPMHELLDRGRAAWV